MSFALATLPLSCGDDDPAAAGDDGASGAGAHTGGHSATGGAPGGEGAGAMGGSATGGRSGSATGGTTTGGNATGGSITGGRAGSSSGGGNGGTSGTGEAGASGASDGGSGGASDGGEGGESSHDPLFELAKRICKKAEPLGCGTRADCLDYYRWSLSPTPTCEEDAERLLTCVDREVTLADFICWNGWPDWGTAICVEEYQPFLNRCSWT